MWLQVWMRDRGISLSYRVCHEICVLLEAIYVGGTFDQLNMASLALFEVLARGSNASSMPTRATRTSLRGMLPGSTLESGRPLMRCLQDSEGMPQ